MLSKPFFRIVAAAAVGALLVSCQDGPTEPPTPPDAAQPASVSISPEAIRISALGDTVRLTAEVLDQSGRPVQGAQVGWASSEPAVATVDAAGLVTAVANGEAAVTASSGQTNASVPISVRQAAASATISPRQLNLSALGDTARLSAKILDARGHAVPGVEVAWSSSDPAVASVDGSGLVAAVGNGDVTITATSGAAEAAVPVSVHQAAASAVIVPDPLSLEAPGDTARLEARVMDALDHLVQGAEVEWSSSDAAVATVDPTGLVTAIGKGDATVFATSGQANATVSVSVRQSAHTVACLNGKADIYPCDGLDLIGRVPFGGLRPGWPAQELNDVWGWTDPLTGMEYALVGRRDGLGIVDLSDPWDPRPLAFLPSPTAPSVWRDVKVYANHAYVVADAAPGHGVQVLDLTRLRDLDEFTELEADGRYTQVSSVHNIAINEETGFAYAVGSNAGGETCGSGLHMIDLSRPTAPAFAGCHATLGTGRLGTGFTHDVQCVIYHGPDAAHVGREICIGSNETRVVVSDVTDKDNPKTLSTAGYLNYGYVHQGWLDEEHRFFYQNDELDEYFSLVSKSRLLVWDLTDLDDPVLVREHYGLTGAIDHNLYVRGDLIYYSNYNFGVRILDISTRESPVELGFFDTVPSTDRLDFGGSWSNYPYLESGLLIVPSEREGLFVLQPRH